MDRVSVADAETGFAALLERVERGEDIVLTREGQPVAKLSALQPGERASDGLLSRARALRAAVASGGESFTWEELKRWRDEGRP